MDFETLGLAQLHLDNEKSYEQNKRLIALLEKLDNKDFGALLDKTIKISADKLPAVKIDGEVKATIAGAEFKVTNLGDLEKHFTALTKAISDQQLFPNEPLPVSVDRIQEVIDLLQGIDDKDTVISFSPDGPIEIKWPKLATDAIPVRLVDREGKTFYTAQFTSTGGGGGSPRAGGSNNVVVPASTTSAVVFTADNKRHAVTVYNNASSAMYLKLGVGAASNDFTVKLNQDDYYETPAGYYGAISAKWAGSAGTGMFTELR